MALFAPSAAQSPGRSFLPDERVVDYSPDRSRLITAQVEDVIGDRGVNHFFVHPAETHFEHVSVPGELHYPRYTDGLGRTELTLDGFTDVVHSTTNSTVHTKW